MNEGIQVPRGSRGDDLQASTFLSRIQPSRFRRSQFGVLVRTSVRGRCLQKIPVSFEKAARSGVSRRRGG